MSVGLLKIYTEGDTARGLGHVTRCSAYAEAWRSEGGRVHWVVDGDDTARAIAAATGEVDVGAWQQGAPDSEMAAADVVLVDAYSVSLERLKALTEAARQAVFIDDHWRDYPAGLILHPSPGPPPTHIAGDRWLVGPAWQPLRPAFWTVAARGGAAEAIGNVLIVFGGSDPRGLGATVAQKVAEALPGVTIDLVGTSVGAIALSGEIRVHSAKSDDQMRRLMQTADVAISAAGQTIAELARCGTPTIMVEVADNQRLQRLHWPPLTGFIDAGTWQDQGLMERILVSLGPLKTAEARHAVSQKASAALDGAGVARLMQRLAHEPGRRNQPAAQRPRVRLAECRLRRVDIGDRERLLTWRNSDPVRGQMFTKRAISPAEHAAWFARAVVDPDTDHLVFEHEGRPLGLTSVSRGGSGGLYIGEPLAPQGSGSALLALTLDHAFSVRGLAELTYEAMAENVRALALYRRFDFVENGDRMVQRDEHSGLERVIRLIRSADGWSRDRIRLVEQFFSGARP